MGWARYAHSMRVFVINSGLFYIRPTLASINLMDRVTHRLNTENGWDQAIFNEVGSSVHAEATHEQESIAVANLHPVSALKITPVDRIRDLSAGCVCCVAG